MFVWSLANAPFMSSFCYILLPFTPSNHSSFQYSFSPSNIFFLSNLNASFSPNLSSFLTYHSFTPPPFIILFSFSFFPSFFHPSILTSSFSFFPFFHSPFYSFHPSFLFHLILLISIISFFPYVNLYILPSIHSSLIFIPLSFVFPFLSFPCFFIPFFPSTDSSSPFHSSSPSFFLLPHSKTTTCPFYNLTYLNFLSNLRLYVFIFIRFVKNF